MGVYHREIEEYVSQLESNTDQYIKARSASEKVQSLDVDIATKQNHIRELDRALAHVNVQKRKDWDRRAGLIKQIKETTIQYGEVVKDTAQGGDAAQLPSLSPDDEKDPELQSYHSAAAQGLGQLQTEIQGELQVFEDTMAAADSHRARWQDRKDLWDKEFEKVLGML